MELDKKIFEKWIKWAKIIKNDLFNNIVDDKKIFNDFINIVNSNIKHIEKNNGRLFCDYIRKWYAANIAIGIRRQMGIKEDEVSLRKLLYQIKDKSDQFTFEKYLEFYPIKEDQVVPWQAATFSIFSEDKNIISTKIINNDIEELEKIAKKVGDYVDRRYAHLDPRKCENITFEDLKISVDLFNKMFCKYNSLLTSEGYSTLESSINYDWQKVFTVPFDIRNTYCE